jgi:hypothetical protein
MINKVYKELDDIMFEDVVDAYRMRDEIRNRYQSKDLVVRQVYKWYFFCELSIVNEGLKSLLWSYISNEEISLEIRVNLTIRYKEFIDRQSKLKREMYEASED